MIEVGISELDRLKRIDGVCPNPIKLDDDSSLVGRL